MLYWLSGLTCTDENFISKAGAQRAASSEGVALIALDTSPSKLNLHGLVFQAIVAVVDIHVRLNYVART